MAGLVTTPLGTYNINALPNTGTFYTGSLPGAGYDNGSGIQAWSTNNVLLVPNTSGNVMLWYVCGATPAGVTQVLVGGNIAGQVLPAATTRTIAATESGWIGPFSPVSYNINNTALVPASIAGAPSIASWPAAALGCWAIAFTTTTTLTVRAYTFSTVQP